MLLADVIHKYEELFSADWITALDWSNEEKAYADGRNKIDEFSKYCFINLSKSILSGEYIPNNLNPLLDQFKETLLKDYLPDDDLPLKLALSSTYSELDGDIQLLLTHYKALIFQVKEKVDIAYHDYLFAVFSTRRENCKHRILQQIIHYVIPLCSLDHRLSYDEDEIQHLILRRKEIKYEMDKVGDEESKSIYEVLNEKCSFLLKKLIRFKGQTEYSIDFESIELSQLDIQVNIFVNFDNFFQFLHEEDHKDIANKKEWERKCRDKTASFLEMVLLMRYYKNHGGNEKQVKKLIENFDEKQDEYLPPTDFDRYAIDTLRNYMYNCNLSFSLKNNQLTFKKLQTQISQVDSLQKQTYIYNFYPYHKIVNYLLSDIRSDILHNKPEEEIHEKITYISCLIEKLIFNLKWCEKHNFYPFQLPYEECLCIREGFEAPLFIPSACAKPIDYAKLESNVVEYKNNLSVLKNEVALYKERQRIEGLKNEIAKSKRNYIEILALFSTIITFIFSSVTIFTDKKSDLTLLEKVENTAIIGFLLLIFCCTLYLITLPKVSKPKEFLTFRNIAFLLLIASYVVFMILII